MLTLICGAAFCVICLQAAVKDVISLTIPNWMNITIAVLFIPAAFSVSLGWTVGGYHLLTALVAFVIGFILFSFGAFGGGDAKMIPAVVLWYGPLGMIEFVFVMAITGGLLCLGILAARSAVPAEIAPGFAKPILSSKAGIPYGVAISAGALLAMPASPILSVFLSQLGNFN
ncbi:MAG: prepilin peptidase [Pseudomonadota bacterium]